MEGDFLPTYGTLRVFAPRLDHTGLDQGSSTDSATADIPLNSPQAQQIAELVSNNTQDLTRSAVFYDEKLPYYVQLTIRNTPSSPHYFENPTNDDFVRFLQSIRIVVDVHIKGYLLKDNAHIRSAENEEKYTTQQYDFFTAALDNSTLIFTGKTERPSNNYYSPTFSSSNAAGEDIKFATNDTQPATTNGISPNTSNTSDETLEPESTSEYWTAIWRINTLITHPRIRLMKPRVGINVTASFSGSVAFLEEEASVPKLSTAVSMMNIGDSKAYQKHKNKNANDSGGGGQGTFSLESGTSEVTIKYLDEFEPVEDTNLFGPLTNDRNLKPLRSRLAATRLISNPPGKDEFKPTALENKSSTDSRGRPVIKSPDLAQQNMPSRTSTPKPRHRQMQSIYSIESIDSTSTITAKVEFPVYPAVNLRLRCTKATGMQDSIVAILEIDNVDNSYFNVLVGSAVLHFTAGSATLFGDVTFPLWLSPGESASIAYHLNHPDAGLPQTRVKPMTIILNSIPVLGDITQEQVEDHVGMLNYEDIGPQIATQWDTVVDFGVVAPPTPGSTSLSAPVSFASASGGVKRLLKVSRSNSMGSLKSHQGSISSSSGNGVVGRVNGGANTATSQLNGLVLSFSAPSAVKVGEVFSWRVFAINKSYANRHLTLYIQPKDSERGSVTSYGYGISSDTTSRIPFLDQYSIQKLYDELSLNGSGLGIVSLMNDVRIGPLNPRACFETEIKMLALSPGQFTLEGLTVVDLTTGDSYDCGRLLDVIISN